MSEEENISVIKSVLTAVNERKLANLRDFLHPEYKRYDLSNALTELAGTVGTADIIQLLLRAMPDLQITGKQFVAQDDKVVAQFAFSGTHQGDFLGSAGTGKRVEINGINIYRLKDGKIIETWQMPDFWGLLRQMGKI